MGWFVSEEKKDRKLLASVQSEVSRKRNELKRWQSELDKTQKELDELLKEASELQSSLAKIDNQKKLLEDQKKRKEIARKNIRKKRKKWEENGFWNSNIPAHGVFNFFRVQEIAATQKNNATLAQFIAIKKSWDCGFISSKKEKMGYDLFNSCACLARSLVHCFVRYCELRNENFTIGFPEYCWIYFHKKSVYICPHISRDFVRQSNVSNKMTKI
jgi:hypothetical protein